jgi:chlorobactene glucosyltransferase
MNLAWLGYLYFGGVILFWLGALVRTARGRSDQRFRVGADDPGPEGAPRVAIIVPARDEARNIEPCVTRALAQDHAGTRVVVLDDGSTDQTPEILARYADRITVVQGGGGPLPEGWLGKPWACQRAGARALEADPRPDWLLFVDADVRLQPRALSAALGYATRHELAMLSGLGHLEIVSFWEQVLQPMIAGLIIAGNPLDRVNDPERRPDRPLANGQFILIRADAWEAVGGHGAVARDVVDDVGMASAVTKAGYPYHLVFMRSLFSCRMYDTFGEVWRGWTKNLWAGVGRSWVRVAGVVTFMVAYILLPHLLLLGALAGLLPAPWGWWAAGTVVAMQVSRIYLDIAFERPLRYGLLMPIGAALTAALFINSGLKAKTATWKGRTVG